MALRAIIIIMNNFKTLLNKNYKKYHYNIQLIIKKYYNHIKENNNKFYYTKINNTCIRIIRE